MTWSPGPHHQVIGRIHRDGQAQPVFAYFVFCNWGSDPMIVDVLGLKDEQHRGVNDPHADGVPLLDDRAAQMRAADLARKYLESHGATL